MVTAEPKEREMNKPTLAKSKPKGCRLIPQDAELRQFAMLALHTLAVQAYLTNTMCFLRPELV